MAIELEDIMPDPVDLEFEPFSLEQVAAGWAGARYELLAYARYCVRTGMAITGAQVRMAVQLADKAVEGVPLAPLDPPEVARGLDR